MSLLSSLETLLDDQAPDWLEGLLDRAEEATESLPEHEAAGVSTALSIIGDHTAELTGLGAGALISVLTRAGFGKMDDARLTYLASGAASVDELLDASRASTGATVDATHKREQEWKAVVAMLEDIGAVLLKVLPVLLMAA